MSLVAALLFGIVAGLRTLTGEAVFFGFRGGTWGIVFILGAIGEYAVDLLPQCPSRTTIGPAIARCASGGFMGWIAAEAAGAAIGVAGALIGTFAGHRLRMRLIGLIGAVPAGATEDVVAIAIAFAAVTTLRQ
ncbi:MAG: hypothetical protein ABR508_07030 [Candidatus Baltobacteraceae bacterium]